MTVSLVEILAAARAHTAPLAAESAGYLLLGVTDHVSLAPRAVLAEDVELLADGSVRLRAREAAGAAPAEIERGLRALLKRALEVASAAGPALRRAADRGDGSGLPALVRELESALIPVNRAAAKRALSRLHRETERALASGRLKGLLATAPSEHETAVVLAADFPEASPVSLPAVASVAAQPMVAPPPVTASATVPPSPPTPLPPQAELELTKPEPVVQRSRQRAQRTPQLGTLVSALSAGSAEAERTERAPLVEELPDSSVDDLVEVAVSAPEDVDVAASEPPPAQPEPSVLPDVVLAMVELHAGVSADEAPTRLRDVVTAVSSQGVTEWPDPAVILQPLSPPPSEVEEAWLTQSSLGDAETSEGDQQRDESTIEACSATYPFESERADPALHEAMTWDPGPVVSSSALPAPALLLPPPAELSPLIPAVLPVQNSQVSELVESFYVSGAAEEHELRAALVDLAGIGHTPVPRRYGESG